MKAIFKPAAAALLCLATDAYGSKLAVESRLAAPFGNAAEEVHTTMLAQSNSGSCASQNNPSQAQVMADLRGVFNGYAST